ncbi:50S ribosomal protein L10 [Aedoeadaptatus ivorii]|uniref:Large ribosomal subunit protein uL10 n=1 Tax=Aedoeadaptatus ivorii TaxID=54006 RepID=A0A3S4Y7W8_9FIRM|nr:50S ribosomal protein L10 [Peptoniphilus ivorii]MDQ0508799.1 large subunit ribosomal protein L10 [Peptoniphilus ivorii]VEJ36081.1 50S ribosomal protein L10 [Peptoniphilus ivorii]
MKEALLQQKIDLVNEIKEKIENSQSIVFVDNKGMTVEQVTELRKQLRENGVDYKVYKNTMLKRAFDALGYEDVKEHLVGPSAVAFGLEDAVQPAKILFDFAKDNDRIEIKAGFLDGKAVDVAAVETLAKLPSREVLIAQLLGGLNAPIQGLATVLSANIKGLAVALDQIREKKEQETA